MESKDLFNPFFRALLSIIGTSIIGKCARRPFYFTCCGMVIFGLVSLSVHFYFSENKSLTQNYPIINWIPFLSILIIYTGNSLGFGGLPYILQVCIKI